VGTTKSEILADLSYRRFSPQPSQAKATVVRFAIPKLSMVQDEISIPGEPIPDLSYVASPPCVILTRADEKSHHSSITHDPLIIAADFNDPAPVAVVGKRFDLSVYTFIVANFSSPWQTLGLSHSDKISITTPLQSEYGMNTTTLSSPSVQAIPSKPGPFLVLSKCEPISLSASATTEDGINTTPELRPSYQSIVDLLSSHPECPQVIKQILTVSQTLPGLASSGIRSPGDEEAHSFDISQTNPQPSPIPHVHITPQERTPSVEAILIPTDEATPRTHSGSEDTIAFDKTMYVSDVAESDKTVITQSPKLFEERPSDPLTRVKAKATAVTALMRLQQHVRRRYNNQRAKLIQDLGL
jgi:hypothetical protein